MIRFFSTLGLVTVFVAGCSSSVPAARVASTETSIRSARESGAESVPVASQHLKNAEGELRSAKAFDKQGDHDRAADMLERADADAALAAALTDEARAKRQLQR